MRGEVISYAELCARVGARLRRGMHFRLRGGHSVLLMSARPDAPYRDQIESAGQVIRYEGHDSPRTGGRDPKGTDQPLLYPDGRPTVNGQFFAAATATERGEQPPEQVQVFEKLRPGTWLDRGVFDLVGASQAHDGRRLVLVFELRAREA